MGLDETSTQHAVSALDVHASLIYIELTNEATHVLTLAARRMRRLLRHRDSILLLEKVCALLLPATPFSGAEAVARRIVVSLSDIPCELHVYHGMTAISILQTLREKGAQCLSHEQYMETFSLSEQKVELTDSAIHPERTIDTLPYLSFLTNYPPFHLLRLLPYEMACQYQCVPVGAERRALTLATDRWLNREIAAKLRSATQREIFQVRCEMAVINEVLQYWQQLREMAERGPTELHIHEAYNHSR